MNFDYIELFGWFGFLFIIYGYYLNAKKTSRLFLHMGNWQYFISIICNIYQHFPPVFYESIYSWDEYLWMDSME